MTTELFSLDGLPIVITGAAGLLGRNHCFAVAEAGGIPILLDNDPTGLKAVQDELSLLGFSAFSWEADTTDEPSIVEVAHQVRAEVGPVYGIVNNVAANPKMKDGGQRAGWLEDFSAERWDREHAINLKSAFLTAKHFGPHLVRRGEGVIVNIASDLAIISPDQRIYREPGVPPENSAKKPMTYSSSKAALLGVTRYLATYWAPLPIRSNALVPGSVKHEQSEALEAELIMRIPLGRLANADEYKGALVFLLSPASSYMNGAFLVVDGGRSIW